MNRRVRPLPLLAALFASASFASAQTLVAHYRLDESGGTVCADSSGQGNSGTYIGAIDLGQPGARPGTGQSVNCNGVDAGAEIFGSTALSPLRDKFTVALWAYLDDPSGYKTIIGNTSSWVVGSFFSNFRFTTRGVQDYILSGIPVQTWFHYAVTFDANHLATFYVDGVAVGSVQGSAPAGNAALSWYIGTLDGAIEWWSGGIDDIQVYDGVLPPADIAALFASPGSTIGGDLGTSFCGPAVPNSGGQSGRILATGTPVAAANDVTLTATDLPQFQFGFFFTSLTQVPPATPPGSQGLLCLGGQLGRYVGPGQIMNAGMAGEFSLALDLTSTPAGGSLVSVAPGETRSFQAWFRDTTPGGAQSSNFTDARAITFQ